MNILIFAVIGILGGFLGGLFGVGGGLIFVPLWVLLKKFDVHTAIGTSMAVIIPTAIAGSLKHAGARNIDWKTALIIAVFAALGAWLGASASIQLETVWLRRFFALFLLFLSFKMFFTN